MIRVSLTVGALLAALFATGAPRAEIAYPVDVAGTAGQWAIWFDADGYGTGEPGQVFRRHVSWPMSDGSAVPGLDPRYRYLLMSRVEPPAIDSRLQVIGYPCPESPDFAADALITTCVAEVRPEVELVQAVRNEAALRKTAAMAAFGIESPVDQQRAIGLLLAERAGQTLAAADAAWLGRMGTVSLDHLNAIDARAREIEAWIVANPGQIPAIGDAEWPAAPAE